MTFLIALLVFILDRVTKIVAVSNMSYGQSIHILPNIFHFTFVLNNGTAFGLFKGANSALAVLSVLVITLIIFYVLKNKASAPDQRSGVAGHFREMSKLTFASSLALGLILGGAIGNLFDRMRFGYVIDFIDFRIWPVFNIADSAITIGTCFLAWNILKQSFKAAGK